MSELMTVPVILTFSDGEKLDVQISMPRKAYWPGQLEKEIMKAFNHNAPPERTKVIKVKVFRNIQEGGFIIDEKRGCVIRV